MRRCPPLLRGSPAVAELGAVITRPGQLDAGDALNLMSLWGARLWSKQVDITRAVFSAQRSTVVQSCTGAGKSHVAANIAWAWLIGGHNRLVVTTAPTARQVNAHVWKEMRAIQRASKFDFGGLIAPKSATWNGAHGREAIGFSSTDDVNYAGFHSKGGTLVIVDDAQGLDDSTWDTLQATLTGVNDRFLALANPVRPSGRFFQWCTTTGTGSVARIKISAFDTPNVKAGRVVVDGTVTREKVRDMRKTYGEGSALWKSRVLGEFPNEDSDLTLVPLAWMEQAKLEYETWRPEIVDLAHEGAVLAADLAGLGKDRGISAIVRDHTVRDRHRLSSTLRLCDPLVIHPKFPVENTMGTVGFLMDQFKRIKPSSFRVDANAMGSGIYDRLRELRVPVVGMVGGHAASDKTRFANQRAEVLHAFREALRPREKADRRPIIAIPWNDRLAHQASTLRMAWMSDGRQKIESKEDWGRRQHDKARTGASPDELDAMSMALCPEPATSMGGGLAAIIAAYG